jgi:hypothetical protein
VGDPGFQVGIVSKNIVEVMDAIVAKAG